MLTVLAPMRLATLTSAAFGDDPGRWPLPAAGEPREHWLRAIAAGGQGRYANARAELDAILRVDPAGPTAALALVAHASFLRQLGWHRSAGRWDGRGLAVASAATGVDAGEARADALIGLAADALGVGRFGLSRRLLERAAAAVHAQPPGRLPVRLAWVTAELAMVTGAGEDAVRHAERAVQLAGHVVSDGHAVSSRRHSVKSSVVLAAALCCAGRPDDARSIADSALEDTGRLGLIPLRWALAALLADIGSATHTRSDVLKLRDAAAAVVRHRGGLWCDR